MSIFKKDKYILKKTFTYFIPAPPERSTGYQEKEFDQVISYLTNKGYELIDIHSQSISYNEANRSAGLWIVATLGIYDKKLAREEINIDYVDISKNSVSKIKIDPDIIHD